MAAMYPKLALGCAALVACGGATSPTVNIGNTGGDSAGMVAAARDAELGKGGTRDYAKAADLYGKLCAEGRGDLAACAALVEAILEARGVETDRRRVVALHEAMCERGDATACAVNAAYEATEAGGTPSADTAKRMQTAVAAVAKACARGEGRACEWRASMYGGDGGTAERKRRTWYGVACKAGRLAACGYLTLDLQLCEDTPGADVAPCEAHVLEGWRDNKYDNDRLDAATRLRNACGAGDAVACTLVPGRGLPLGELCDAHDYGACAQLGCVGDDTAAEEARAKGVVRADCRAAERNALREWERTPVASRSTYAPVVAEMRGPIGARAAKPFEAVRFTLRGGRDTNGWPRFAVYNMHGRAVSELAVCLYAYDADATQVARAAVALPSISVASNAVVPLPLEGSIATVLPATADEIQVDYERVRFDGDPASIADPSRCPAQRAYVQQPPTMTW